MSEGKAGARSTTLADLFGKAPEATEDGRDGQVVGTFDVPAGSPRLAIASGMAGFLGVVRLAVTLGDRKLIREIEDVIHEGLELLVDAQGKLFARAFKDLDGKDKEKT